MRLKVGFIMDPFERLDSIEEDTSCCLILECLKRGYEVFYFQIKDLQLKEGKVFGEGRKITGKKQAIFIMEERKMISLDRLQVLFMRKDPPFNLDYLYSTYILELLVPYVLIINNPRGIRDANEKIYPLRFPSVAPKSLVSKEPEKIKRFLYEVGGKAVVKPLNECSGKGIFYLEKNDINLNSLLEGVTSEGKEFVIVQEYLPQVKEGDKRILLLEGKPIGAMRRIPPPDDYRANIHRGAKFVKTEITSVEERICQYLSSQLVKDGIYFAGIDVIADKVVEINVTSPAGIPEIDRLEGVFLEEDVMNWVEKKVKEKKSQ